MGISALDISTSALVAQRIRLDAISSNIANMSTMRNEGGDIEAYQARFVVFQTDPEKSTKHGAIGVKVASVKTSKVEPNYRRDPNHPLAIKEGPHAGMVAYPSVNLTQEFVDALQATRAYEANIGVMEISKNMGQQTLRILA
jgi:flagellar basal-body rod protein FlgC